MVKRREFLVHAGLLTGAVALGLPGCRDKKTDVLNGVKDFLYRVANEDGSFRPGIDPGYKGTSDTGLSGIAAPTYAVILFKTFGWRLPYPDRTKAFFISCQKPDGAFYPPTGSMDPDAPLSKLYNTVQGVVSLRLLGSAPRYDPMPVVDYFFQGDRFKDLPLYTTSFFPLFFTAMGKKMPDYIDQKMRKYLLTEQKEDGYLGNHVASTFHAVHYFRLIGEPVPKARVMVDRVLKDQKKDGSWHLFEPAWDVHACFDALFVLRQIGDPNDPRIKKAYGKATKWILTCRRPDGGFTHFPDETISDVDAVYFQIGGLIEAGYLQTKPGLKNEEILGWGHAMVPGKHYSCIG